MCEVITVSHESNWMLTMWKKNGYFEWFAWVFQGRADWDYIFYETNWGIDSDVKFKILRHPLIFQWRIIVTVSAASKTGDSPPYDGKFQKWSKPILLRHSVHISIIAGHKSILHTHHGYVTLSARRNHFSRQPQIFCNKPNAYISYNGLPYFSARCERVSASDEPIIVAWHSYIERFIFPKESLHSTFCCIPDWMTERGGNQFGIVARLNPNPNFHSTEETITNTYVLWIRPSYFSYPHE